MTVHLNTQNTQELIPELMESGSGALLDELDTIIPHISGGSASVEDFVAKKKAVTAAHQDNPRHVEASAIYTICALGGNKRSVADVNHGIVSLRSPLFFSECVLLL